MDLRFTPEDEAFRHEVRAFIEANLPPEIAADSRRWVNPRVTYWRRWQKILADKGWGAPHWPVEWGGTDWSPLRKHIFSEELYRADAPDFGWQGTHMMAPVLFAFGSEEQCRRFAPPMLRGDEFWCQGFSEPGAGSDLASLKTTAELVGDEWVINGQKIWTSDAAHAEWGFFLVRTDSTVKPQRGLSFVVARMDTPGITVRPIQQIDGRSELNEVFLDDVRIPRDQLIGEPGKGWTYAKYLLEKGAHGQRLPVFQPPPLRDGEGHRTPAHRERTSAAAGPGLRAQARPGRGRSRCAQLVRAAHPRRRDEQVRHQRRRLRAQDPRLGDAAARHGVADRRARAPGRALTSCATRPTPRMQRW